MKRHSERERALSLTRTTLIDTLRLVDEGKLDEAVIGCAMALQFLAPATNEDRVQELLRGTLVRAVERRQHEESTTT